MAKIVVFGRFVRQNRRVSGFERIFEKRYEKKYIKSQKRFQKRVDNLTYRE